jgi:IS605 OrfB family transposase
VDPVPAATGMEPSQAAGRSLVGREQQGSLQVRPGRARTSTQELGRRKERPRQGPPGTFPTTQEERPGPGRLPVHYRRDQGAPRPQPCPAARIGVLKTHESTRKLARRLEQGTARILAATITRTAERWFVSFTVEVDRAIPEGNGHDTVIGVDVGIRHLATLSTEATIANPRALQRSLRKLRRLNRQLARRRPGSKRRRATRRKLARVHARAANLRRDALHKLSTTLATQHGTVVVEQLNVAWMIRNRHLARAIADTGMAELRRHLTYKTTWYGSRLVVADRLYPPPRRARTVAGRKPSSAWPSAPSAARHAGCGWIAT